MASQTKNQGPKGKQPTPITAWSREAKLTRSYEGIWGASKFSHEPDVFIANILRPVASAIAESHPGRSTERQLLIDYAETDFRLDNEALQRVNTSRQKLRNVDIDIEMLEEISSRRQSAHSFSAHAILTLMQGAETYIAPNTALQTGANVVSQRGDRQIILEQIKYLAYLTLGDAVIDPHKNPCGTKHVA